MKFLFLLFFASKAFGIACNPINLVTERNSPFQKIPVTDQNGSNTCYAFAAAQMMNYEIIKRGGRGPEVHPAWVALNSPRSNPVLGTLSSGLPHTGSANMVNVGNCPMSYVTKELSHLARIGGMSESKLLETIDNLIWRVNKDGKKLSDKEVRDAYFSSVDKSCKYEPLWDQLGPIILNLNVINSDTLLKDVLLRQCDKLKYKLNIPAIKPQFASALRMATPALIEQSLKNNRSPVGIGYCSAMLRNPRYIGLLRPQGGQIYTQKPDCGRHASIIVGQKKIGGACHFLLRNSYGSGWNNASRNFKCLCRHKATGALVDDCQVGTHNNGQYTVDSCWIPETTIAWNTYYTSVIPK